MSTVTIPRFHDSVCTIPSPAPAVLPIEAAYHRVREEIAAVPEASLVAINVDLPLAAAIAKASAARLVELRARMVDELPRFDVGALDKLVDYADALVFLHAEHKRRETPQDALPALYEEALLFRENVVAVGRLLVSLQLLDTTSFATMGSALGYRNVGVELIGVCTTLLEKLPQLGARCPITQEQLQRGRALGNLLLETVSEREIESGRKSAVQKERHRAFTLLAAKYDEVRRAVSYLRWHEDDADALAPSFFTGRNAAARSPKEDAATASRANAAEPTGAQAAGASPSRVDGEASALADETTSGDPLFTPISDEPFARG